MGWVLNWRKAKGSQEKQSLPVPVDGCQRAETAAVLLSSPRRRKLLEHIWQRTALSHKQFDDLYLAPLHRFAELVQQLPASQNHHHAYPGGMLDHGLEIVAYALKIRQSYLLPLGSTPETQAAQTEAWTATIAYAALLHDIGKIAVDIEVDLASGKRWHPWHGPLTADYRFRFVEAREYRLHAAAAGLVYTQILSAKIMDWLSGYPELWASLVYVLAGQYEHAGILGELVIQADKASVAQELGGNPARAMSAPKNTLQRQLVEGLRVLVADQLKLNQPEASDGWLTGDALWLVSKTVADKLRAHMLSQGVEGIPSSNSTFFNVLQDHGLILGNQSGKAIWKAEVVNGSWQKTLTFLKLAPALVWDPDSRPPSFSGTVTPIDEAVSDETMSSDFEGEPGRTHLVTESTVNLTEDNVLPVKCPLHMSGENTAPNEDDVDILLGMLGMNEQTSTEDHAPTPTNEGYDEFLQPTSEIKVGKVYSFETPENPLAEKNKLGLCFMQWLRNGIIQHSIVINDAKAKVHSVAGTALLVTPGIFQRFAQEHTGVLPHAKKEGLSDWLLVQRSFEKLALHIKREDGLNIWVCEIKGPRKSRTVKGYLMKDPLSVFTEKPYDNPYLNLLEPITTKG